MTIRGKRDAEKNNHHFEEVASVLLQMQMWLGQMSAVAKLKSLPLKLLYPQILVRARLPGSFCLQSYCSWNLLVSSVQKEVNLEACHADLKQPALILIT